MLHTPILVWVSYIQILTAKLNTLYTSMQMLVHTSKYCFQLQYTVSTIHLGKTDSEAQLFYQMLLVQYLVARLTTKFPIINDDKMTNMTHTNSTQ